MGASKSCEDLYLQLSIMTQFIGRDVKIQNIPTMKHILFYVQVIL